MFGRNSPASEFGVCIRWWGAAGRVHGSLETVALRASIIRESLVKCSLIPGS